MERPENTSVDIFGIKPIGNAIEHVTKTTVDGMAAFLGRICNPAAEEVGHLLQDKVKRWRAERAQKVVIAAMRKHEQNKIDPAFRAHPRLVNVAIEQGSWQSDDMICEMWGGLLASSCSPNGIDDGNLIFLNTLSQLTSLQVRILKYSCEHVEKKIFPLGLIGAARELPVNAADLESIAQCNDIHRIDRELDHLRSLELLAHGIDAQSGRVNLAPTSFALNLYVRCEGFVGSALDYFGLIPPPVEGR